MYQLTAEPMLSSDAHTSLGAVKTAKYYCPSPSSIFSRALFIWFWSNCTRDALFSALGSCSVQIACRLEPTLFGKKHVKHLHLESLEPMGMNSLAWLTEATEGCKKPRLFPVEAPYALQFFTARAKNWILRAFKIIIIAKFKTCVERFLARNTIYFVSAETSWINVDASSVHCAPSSSLYFSMSQVQKYPFAMKAHMRSSHKDERVESVPLPAAAAEWKGFFLYSIHQPDFSFAPLYLY